MPTKPLNKEQTERGFFKYDFTDDKGNKCSLQESSITTRECIWLGANDCDIQHFVPYQGWNTVDISKVLGVTEENKQTWIANTRMHLTRSQVEALLPILQDFVENGL